MDLRFYASRFGGGRRRHSVALDIDVSSSTQGARASCTEILLIAFMAAFRECGIDHSHGYSTLNVTMTVKLTEPQGCLTLTAIVAVKLRVCPLSRKCDFLPLSVPENKGCFSMLQQRINFWSVFLGVSRLESHTQPHESRRPKGLLTMV